MSVGTGNEKELRLLDWKRLEAQLPELSSSFRTASPFPHIVLDDFLDPGTALLAMTESATVADAGWTSFAHLNERKLGHTRPEEWGPTLRAVLDELQSPRFVRFLGSLSGIEGLVADDSLAGGGLHQSQSGGFLNIHADFTVHPRHRNWQRQVNVLLYLNEEWPSGYGGDLELWSTDMKRCERVVAPIGNRVVIFRTSADSFHGHPEPLRCPEGTSRRSLALYYFTEETDPTVRSTEYRARPGESKTRAAVIYVDKKMLRGYDWLRRRSKLRDETIGRMLASIDRFRRRW
jgi:hypothetical protein